VIRSYHLLVTRRTAHRRAVSSGQRRCLPWRDGKPSSQRQYHRIRVLVRSRRMAQGKPGHTVHGARLQPIPQPSQE
jgi:hypothetical protein